MNVTYPDVPDRAPSLEVRDATAIVGVPPAQTRVFGLRLRGIVGILLAAIVVGGLAGGVSGYLVGRRVTTVQLSPTVTTVTSLAADTSSAGLPALIAAARMSIVAIDVHIPVSTPHGQMTEDGSGTGIVIRSDGMIATNAHVIEGACEILVTLSDGTQMTAKVVNRDRHHDLAVIHVQRTGLVVADFGDSGTLRVGDPVVAIGHALALGGDPTATAGIVPALNREISTQTSAGLPHMLQVDAAINSGNSGGPLIDARGQVVGINAAGSTSAENIGFAIPIADALPILLNLMTGAP
ncbi:MAG: trypsin-like peptidase domain-containing protein [Dehalococcoidia bacterium]|nr:trypsin-like peptidase domain-containing protein [Dehalococcoidia bacterium]